MKFNLQKSARDIILSLVGLAVGYYVFVNYVVPYLALEPRLVEIVRTAIYLFALFFLGAFFSGPRRAAIVLGGLLTAYYSYRYGLAGFRFEDFGAFGDIIYYGWIVAFVGLVASALCARKHLKRGKPLDTLLGLYAVNAVLNATFGLEIRWFNVTSPFLLSTNALLVDWTRGFLRLVDVAFLIHFALISVTLYYIYKHLVKKDREAAMYLIPYIVLLIVIFGIFVADSFAIWSMFKNS